MLATNIRYGWYIFLVGLDVVVVIILSAYFHFSRDFAPVKNEFINLE